MSFDQVIEPYLELDGVESVALVSSEGLLVNETRGGPYDFETIGAHASSFLSLALGLADAMDERPPKVISLHLGNRGLIIAPLTEELFLVIAGTTGILSLAASGPVFT